MGSRESVVKSVGGFCVVAVLALPLLQGCAEAVVVGSAAAIVSIHDRRPTRVMVRDQNIEILARKALARDVSLADRAHLNVTSFNGVALVTGEVPSKALRARAVALVQAIPGVHKVRREIRVAPPASFGARTSESMTTARVKAKLFASDFDATRVKIVSAGGEVFLMGLVTRDEAGQVMALANHVGGVDKVVDVFEYID